MRGKLEMNAPVGLFRAHAFDIDRLVKTTVGRSEMLEELLERLGQNAGKKGGQHFLFMGPRGIGKTHFLSLVEQAVQTKDRLRNSYRVIRFPEENNRILCFADIVLEIIKALAEKDTQGQWNEWYADLSVKDDDGQILDAAIPRLRQYCSQSNHTLLLLMENLNTLLGEQIKNRQDIHRFRTFLMDSPFATLIATSPIFFPGINDVGEPFFDFFDVQILEDLSEALTLDLVKKNLEADNRTDLLDGFDTLRPKIKALHTMTGGNPRLIMMLYELIAYDNILEVKAQFQKLLDGITPFYQDRMKDLAPQERALLETMALMRTEPRTPRAIAARMRMSPQQTSSLLKRLIGAGYLTASVNPNDRRSRLYRIKEGFFDLWLAMSGSRATRTRLGYLVRLFELWYQDRHQRDQKRIELREAAASFSTDDRTAENRRLYLNYLSEIGDGDERCTAKLELSMDLLKSGKASKAQNLLKEIEPLAPKKGIFTWMTRQAMQWSKESVDLDVSQWFDELIDYWKVQRSGDLENAVAVAQRLGMDLSGHGLHKIRIELLEDAVACAKKPGDKVGLYFQMAKSQEMDGQLENAMTSLHSALTICRQIGDKAGEGTTLNNISQIHHAYGDFNTVLDYLNQSLAIQQDIGDKAGEGTTLNNISQVYDARGDFDTALDYLNQSLAICQQIGDKAGEGTTLNNISQIYKARGDLDTALEYLNQSLAICQQIGDNAGEGITLNNISQVYDARGDLDTALEYLNQSLAICQQIGDKAGLCATLFNIGHIHFKKDEHPKAVGAWGTVYRLATSMHLAQALEALEKLADELELKGGMDGWARLSKEMEKEPK
jgi:tetratricopeptide (TPR) repeat protein